LEPSQTSCGLQWEVGPMIFTHPMATITAHSRCFPRLKCGHCSLGAPLPDFPIFAPPYILILASFFLQNWNLRSQFSMGPLFWAFTHREGGVWKQGPDFSIMGCLALKVRECPGIGAPSTMQSIRCQLGAKKVHLTEHESECAPSIANLTSFASTPGPTIWILAGKASPLPPGSTSAGGTWSGQLRPGSSNVGRGVSTFCPFYSLYRRKKNRWVYLWHRISGISPSPNNIGYWLKYFFLPMM
jgi:hypothetical protein